MMGKRSIAAIALATLTAAVSFAAPLDDDLGFDRPLSTATGIDDAAPTVKDIVREVDSDAVEAEELPTNDATRMALAAFKTGDIETCTSHLKTAIAERPTLPEARVILAGFYLSVGRWTEARRLLEEAATKGSQHPQLHLSLAKLARLEGRLADADAHYDKVESRGIPKHWSDEEQAWLKLSMLEGRVDISQQRENWETTRALLGELKQLQPQNTLWNVRLARANFLAGRLDDAFDELDIAHRRDPQLDPPELSMAVLHVQAGKYADADPWYEKAIEKYPGDLRVGTSRIMALLYQGRAKEADKQASSLAATGKASLLLTIQRGIIARQLGNWEEAQSHLSDALKRDHDNLEASYQLVLTLAAMSDAAARAKALEIADAFVERNPRLSLAHAALGAAHHGNQQFEEAEKALAAAVALPHVRPEALFVYGRVLDAQGKQAQSRSVATQLRPRLDEPNVFVLRESARKWVGSTPPE